MSPFMELYGYHPLSITSPLKGNTKVHEVEEHIGHQQEVLKLLKDNFVMGKNRLKNKQINISVKENLKWGIGYF
jgi:hypothetical protein